MQYVHSRKVLWAAVLLVVGGVALTCFQGLPIRAEVATPNAPDTVDNAPTKSTEVVAETLIQSSRSWDGELLPDYPEEDPEITVLKITIPAGAKLPVHKHPVINVGVLLEGELTVHTEEDEVLHLREGDPIIELVDKWHYGENEGDEAAVIVVVYAGVPGEPVTIHKGAEEAY